MSMTTTKWFDGSKFVPGTPGIYQREYRKNCPVFARWTGEKWLLFSPNINIAKQQTKPSYYQSLPWRGLRDKP